MPLGRRGGFEGLEVCSEFAWGFQIQATRESCARRTRDVLGRGKFQPSFFLPLFGPGKIPGEAFFCHCFGEPCRRGGCWGCEVRFGWCGDLAGGWERQRQRAMRVRGSAQGREMSLTRFVFFRLRFARISPSLPNRLWWRQLLPPVGAAVCRIASPTAMA